MGFFDQGKSFTKAMNILDTKFGLFEWISEKTIMMIEDEKQSAMVNWDVDEVERIFEDYLSERANNLLQYFNPIDAIEVVLGYVIITVLQAPGKFTGMSPLITGILPQALTLDGLMLQFIWSAFFMEFWANFNIMFLLHQLFSIVQYFLMFLLSWNVEIYIYDFRIVRYVSLFFAFIYDIFYVVMAASALDLVFIKGK